MHRHRRVCACPAASAPAPLAGLARRAARPGARSTARATTRSSTRSRVTSVASASISPRRLGHDQMLQLAQDLLVPTSHPSALPSTSQPSRMPRSASLAALPQSAATKAVSPSLVTTDITGSGGNGGLRMPLPARLGPLSPVAPFDFFPCGGARAQGSPRPAWSGVWPVISITTHTSTLKQPSPPPSPSPMADTPRTVPAVLPQPAGEDDRSRSPCFQCFHTHHSLTLYRCVVVPRCISLYRGVVVSPCISPSCCIVVSLYLVCPVVSLYRCLSPCISLSCCIVVSLYLAVSLYRCVVV